MNERILLLLISGMTAASLSCDSGAGGRLRFNSAGYAIIDNPALLAALPDSIDAVEIDRITAPDLGKLTRLLELRRLRLRECDALGVEDFQYLARVPSLEELQILSCDGTSGETMDIIARLPGLHTLAINSRDLYRESIARLAASGSLRALSLRGWPHLDDASLEHVARIENLEKLDLGALPEWNRVTDADLGEEEPPELFIDPTGVPRGKISDIGLAHLAVLDKLTLLGLSGHPITTGGLKYLFELTGLTVLDLSSTNISDEGIEEIAKMSRLRFLDLSFTKVTGSGFDRLARLEHLETLLLNSYRDGIPESALDADAIRPLLACEVLETLELANSKRIDDEAAELIAFMPGLVHLDLRGTGVSDKGIKPLGRLEKLRWLSLKSTAVTVKGITEIRALLPECQIHW